MHLRSAGLRLPCPTDREDIQERLPAGLTYPLTDPVTLGFQRDLSTLAARRSYTRQSPPSNRSPRDHDGVGPLKAPHTVAGPHPRWRGADLGPAGDGGRVGEPPRLARGRHKPPTTTQQADRTTPAGAGPTRSASSKRGACGNHPRWRGADISRSGRALRLGEPSPLARGRHCGGQFRYGPRRTPRWRGADESPMRSAAPPTEPSPLARGRPPPHVPAGRGERTTPAGAGPTGRGGLPAGSTANHPRWRGPTPRGVGGGVAERRTTPAGAGPTPPADPPEAHPENHPRWRGADRAVLLVQRGDQEPPPLARSRRRAGPKMAC